MRLQSVLEWKDNKKAKPEFYGQYLVAVVEVWDLGTSRYVTICSWIPSPYGDYWDTKNGASVQYWTEVPLFTEGNSNGRS